MQTRYLKQQITKDLAKKMVFVGGPRQVGKTTLAKSVIHDFNNSSELTYKNLTDNSVGYFNWDIAIQREQILKHEYPDVPLWVFDEIHKYKDWRNYLKGLFDQFNNKYKILVTGSAQLDYYRYGGDSLQGRYHYLRLHPLSVAELKLVGTKEMEELLNYGGFPEPFFSNSLLDARRWSAEYRQRLIEDDLVKIEQVKDLGKLELLMIRLPDLVGSPLSINALREDLQVSHATMSNWLDIFTRLYAIFRIPTFGSNLVKAVKKEQKHYHFDWTLIKDLGIKFENMVAMHLLKWVHYLQDTQARKIELRYFRDIEGREVDFIITEDATPIYAIECKYSDADVSKHLIYFKNKYPTCDVWQVHCIGSKDYLSKHGIRVCSALKLLEQFV